MSTPDLISESQTIRLNCLVLGDDPNEIFQVEIALTASVSVLKDLIKEKKKPQFDHIPASGLKLWNVDLPVDDALDRNMRRDIEQKLPLSPVMKLLKLFSKLPEEEHLHIVIQTPDIVPPPPPFVPMINLNCLVLGDEPSHIFPIKIAQTDTVGDLKKVIKEEKKHTFDDVDADSLELWKVDNLPAEDSVRLQLQDEDKISRSPMTELVDVFPASAPPEKGRLHIVIQRPLAAIVPPPLPEISSLVDTRQAYVNYPIMTPSEGAQLSNFRRLQADPTYQIFCSRPRGAADPVPVTLLEPIFAQFVDDCQNYEPIDGDHAFVEHLSHKMCDFYTTEPERMHDFRQIFDGYGISLNAGAVGSSRSSTDGHILIGTHATVIVEGKNEIGSGGADPFAEALLYYRKFLQFVDDRRNKFKEHKALLPSFEIICAGASIGIIGTVFTTKVQSDILVPIIPLFWHSTDIPMKTMAIRTLAALRVAVKKLERLHTGATTTHNPCRGEGSIIYPYARDYVDSAGTPHTFSYDDCQPFRERLIFYGKNTNGERICVKFSKTYSREAHMFCASKGHAPTLIACKPLPGGWNMVVMEFIDIYRTGALWRAGSYREFSQNIPEIFSIEERMTTLIKELHAEGYVHGDLRDANVFVQVDKGTAISNFMVIDFDWAGPVGKTRYPLGINRIGIDRPDNAQGGRWILPEDDLDMLGYLFCRRSLVGRKRKRDEGPPAEAAPILETT